MPFIVTGTDRRRSQRTSSANAAQVFVGRADQIAYVRRHAIDPDIPDHNIVCLHGLSGVGKSTLLSRIESDSARRGNVARVDERQATPIDVMQTLATQLALKGKFERALDLHRATLRKLMQDREDANETVERKVTGQIAKVVAETVPIFGPLLERGAEQLVDMAWNGVEFRRRRREAIRQEDPLRDLTRAFVNELDELIERSGRRVYLCLDTFERTAEALEPWILDVLLQENLSSEVVLLVAGCDPLSRTGRPRRRDWLAHVKECTLVELEVEAFSQSETSKYLAELKIVDGTRVEQIWRLSQGLPLYLGMLSVYPEGEIDLTEDVVHNFLRWLPHGEPTKRRLLLEAALFTKPFNRDDLKAFGYVKDEEPDQIYSWLLQQPFIRGTGNGRYRYHDIVRDLFQRYLQQRSPEDTRAACAAIAAHDCTTLAALENEDPTLEHGAWLDTALALAVQWLRLPDSESHARAVDLVVRALGRLRDWERGERVSNALRELKDTSALVLPARTRRVLGHLLDYQHGGTAFSEWHSAASFLVEALVPLGERAATALAQIQLNRATKFRLAGDLKRALQCCDEVVGMWPAMAHAWNHKGFLLAAQGEYNDAIAAYREALRLDPEHAYARFNMGVALHRLQQPEAALAAFDECVRLRPDAADAHFNRGAILQVLDRTAQAGGALDDALHAAARMRSSSASRFTTGYLLTSLRRPDEALAAYDEAVKFDVRHARSWYERGNLLIDLKRPEDAAESLRTSLDIDPSQAVAWNSLGCALSDLGRYQDALQSFKRATEINPRYSIAWNDLGYALIKLGRPLDALDSLVKATELDPRSPNPWRWRAQALRDLNRLDEALDSIAHALALDAKYSTARYVLADILDRLGRREAALTAYNEALENPSNDSACYEAALLFYEQAIEAMSFNADLWARKGKLLIHLARREDAQDAFSRASQIDPDYRFRSGWSNGLGRRVSPDLVDDEYLDAEIVMLLEGNNLLGEQVFTYLELTGRNLKRLFAKMQTGENFKPVDFGVVLAGGEGAPPPDVRARMEKDYHMTPVPRPLARVAIIEPDSPEDGGGG